MAKGQVVVAQLQTPSPALKFPIADTRDLLGGHQEVDTIADRNNIPAQRRRPGMVVYVKADGKEYQLRNNAPATGNTSNAHWTEYAPGVPSGGFLTEHQKVETMKYETDVNLKPTSANPTPGTTNLLTAVLANLQAQIDERFKEHQKMESIQLANPAVFNDGNNYSTLLDKLQNMDLKIANLTNSATQYIEDIDWTTTPTGHKSSLEEELIYLYDNMNNATKIMVDTATTPVTLQKKLNDLTSFRPAIEEIKGNSGDLTGKNLTEYLTNHTSASEKISVTVDGSAGAATETKTLKAWISQFKNLTANTVTMADIGWGTVTPPTYTPYGSSAKTAAANVSQNFIDIYTYLEKMNDPSQISVTNSAAAGTTDLQTELTNLKNAIAGTAVEDIKWNAADTAAGAAAGDGLKSTIDKIFAALADMNDPSKITTGKMTAGNKLDADLQEIHDALQAISLTTDKITHSTTTFSNFNPVDAKLSSILSAIDNALGTVSSTASGITADGLNFSSAFNTPSSWNEISVVSGGSLVDLFGSVDSAITAAKTSATSKTVEQTKWGAALSGATVLTGIVANQALSDTILAIDAVLATHGSSISNMNDPTKINTGVMDTSNTNTLAQDLAAIQSKLQSIENDLSNVSGTVEDTTWDAIPSTNFTNFPISAAGETLDTTLAAIDAAITSAKATAASAGAQKQNLLFNVNAPESGVIACEYLTMFKAKIEEIAFYVNSDATKASDLKFYVEVAKATSGQTTKATYVNLLEGAATAAGTGSVLGGTLATNTLVQITDLTSNNYLLDENTLIRLRIVAVGSSDTINAFNVRVKLVECDSSVTDVMGMSSSALTS